LEKDRRRKQRNRIWLALLLLGAIIQLNLIFNDSPAVQSATAFLDSFSDKTTSSTTDQQKNTNTTAEKSEKEQTTNQTSKSNEVQPSAASVQNSNSTVPAQSTGSPDLPATGKMIAKIPRTKPTVYLTFDDGPGNYTKDIVAILDKYNVKGAFFWIGDNLKNEQQVAFAKQMLAEGHVIGTHTMHHEMLEKKPKAVQVGMIRESTTYISQKIGAPIYYFRPPYGAVDNNTKLASKELNQILAYWNVDSLDWKYGETNPDLVMNNIAKEVKPGSIILMHEKKPTVQLLPKIIELLKNMGYDLAPLPTPRTIKAS
jgi:peptidoglycan/xylan/chitin deacetylase (PgdA/CDA1 family)